MPSLLLLGLFILFLPHFSARVLLNSTFAGSPYYLTIHYEAGSILTQVTKHCLSHNFTDIECSDIFIAVVTEYFPHNYSIPLPLVEIVISHKAVENQGTSLKIMQNGGPLFSQVKNYCDIISCDEVSIKYVRSFFLKNSLYWIPNVYIFL